MRVFICEYVTSGGLRDKPLPELLLPSGSVMRDALLADVEELPGVQTLIAHDDRLPSPAAHSLAVGAADDPFAVWAELARQADVVWPVAPETEGALPRLIAQLAGTGTPLIASGASALAIAASKLATARHLAAADIAGIPTYPIDAVPDLPPGPIVTKPDRGAGCENVRAWPDRAALPRTPGLVAQPFVSGPVLELTVLVRPDGIRLLTANRLEVQQLVGSFSIAGCIVGAEPDRNGALAALARRVVDSLPGLAGIIGIDVILAADGPKVLEINARPTLAYAGLHAALGMNPAAFLPQLIRDARPPALPPARPVALKMR